MKKVNKIQESYLHLMTNNYKLSYEGLLDLTTLFIFYKNSFYKNHEAENRRKIKNYVRITPGSRSPVL